MATTIPTSDTTPASPLIANPPPNVDPNTPPPESSTPALPTGQTPTPHQKTPTNSTFSSKVKSALAGTKETVVSYSKWLAEQEWKGQMPWTHWYCCNLVDGYECEKENHRIKKKCGKCGHVVCENCVKSTL